MTPLDLMPAATTLGWLVQQVPDERSGIASATLNVFRMVGLSLGVAVMGAVVAAHWPGDLARSAAEATAFTTGIAMGFWVNAVLAVVAAVLAVVAIRAPRVAPSTDLPTSR